MFIKEGYEASKPGRTDDKSNLLVGDNCLANLVMKLTVINPSTISQFILLLNRVGWPRAELQVYSITFTGWDGEGDLYLPPVR